MAERGLTHLDPLGRARMVEVTPKEPTHRRAIARGRVYMSTDTTSLVARGAVNKGDVLSVARVAGLQAAKRASDLIPLCHPVLVGTLLVNFRIEDTYIEVESQVETVDRTGVEMEALTAVSVACLTIYDMCKSVDRSMMIGDIALWEKSGGRSGTYRRTDDAADDATPLASGSDRSRDGDMSSSVTNDFSDVDDDSDFVGFPTDASIEDLLEGF